MAPPCRDEDVHDLTSSSSSLFFGQPHRRRRNLNSSLSPVGISPTHSCGSYSERGEDGSVSVSPKQPQQQQPGFRRRHRRRSKKSITCLQGYSHTTMLTAAAVITILLFWIKPWKPSTFEPGAAALRNTRNETQHEHAIPNVLIFTHAVHLLEPEDTWQVDDDDALLEEYRALAQNVRATVNLFPNAQVVFWTDEDCLSHLIRPSFTALTDFQQAVLHKAVKTEPRGMIRADVCRAVALWETGGLYFDVDVGVRMNVFQGVLPANTTFTTVRVHKQSHHPKGLFQAFWGALPRHPVTKRYLQLFCDFYADKLHDVPKNGPTGVLLLRKALDEVWQDHFDRNGTIGDDDNDDIKPANVYELSTIQLWQEFLYYPGLQKTLFKSVPPPVWGHRRACKFVVAARDYSHENGILVPLYSRVGGSRMCPWNESTAHVYEAALLAADDNEQEDEEEETDDEEEDEEIDQELADEADEEEPADDGDVAEKE